MDSRYLRIFEEQGLTVAVSKMMRDATEITDGASNPVSISQVLAEMILFVSRKGSVGAGDVKEHPAIRCVLDHLNVIILGSNHPATTDNLDYLKLGKAFEAL